MQDLSDAIAGRHLRERLADRLNTDLMQTGIAQHVQHLIDADAGVVELQPQARLDDGAQRF